MKAHHTEKPKQFFLYQCKNYLDMSDLATVTHSYEKAVAPFPALKSTWISQSLWSQAANGFSKQVPLATSGGNISAVVAFKWK